mmetsp:Transcript_13197/g.19927  ORF Transcript_13197/g.19927 Transcript_13197/m.19927 type:complete len:215 (+) Transcript_13197:80-724(+)
MHAELFLFTSYLHSIKDLPVLPLFPRPCRLLIAILNRASLRIPPISGCVSTLNIQNIFLRKLKVRHHKILQNVFFASRSRYHRHIVLQCPFQQYLGLSDTVRFGDSGNFSRPSGTITLVTMKSTTSQGRVRYRCYALFILPTGQVPPLPRRPRVLLYLVRFRHFPVCGFRDVFNLASIEVGHSDRFHFPDMSSFDEAFPELCGPFFSKFGSVDE